MRATKSERRQAKSNKRRRGMQVRGRSVLKLAELNTTGKRKKKRRKRRK